LFGAAQYQPEESVKGTNTTQNKLGKQTDTSAKSGAAQKDTAELLASSAERIVIALDKERDTKWNNLSFEFLTRDFILLLSHT